MDERPIDRDWADQWTALHMPVETLLDLQRREGEHALAFTQEYGRFANQFEVAFGAHAALLDDLNFINKGAWPPHRAVQYMLLAHNAKTFHSALDCLVRGRYEDATTLCRGLYETFIRAIWISAHPTDAYNAMVRSPPAGSPVFNLTNFVRDQLHLDWETTYSVSSAIAHSNGVAVLSSLIAAASRAGEPERFRVAVAFDRDRLELAAPLLSFALLTHMRFAISVLVGDLEHPHPARLELAKEAVALFTASLKNHPKPYWRAVATDLDMLFDLVAAADRGEDWRMWLRSRQAPR